MNRLIISPSILSADFANLEKDILRAQNAGADWIHVDVMDGHFVPNITIGVPVVKSLRAITNLPLDVHLMIENPDKYIKPFANAGADIITFHYETGVNISDTINLVKSFGKKVGISIKPKTKPEVLIPYMNDIDMVLIMTVEPGFGGQQFMEDCAKKIKYIKENSNKDLIIQVDGGINDKTAKICKNYGANSLVAGNYIYKSENIVQAIKTLRD